MVHGKFILQIWVTWASKITIKNFQLCSIKIKGSHAPCDVNATTLFTFDKLMSDSSLEGKAF